MSMGLTLGYLGLGSAPVSASTPVAGTSPTTFGVTPTVHYHPHSQSATLDGSNRVLSCPDIMGLAALTGTSFGGSTVGPVQMTDALGRKFWRFSPAQYLLIANALTGLNHRQLAVFAVWRAHKVTRGEQIPLFSTRYSSYTDDSTNTNRSNGFICAINSAAGALASSVGRLFNGTVDSFTAAVDPGKMVPPANLHVVGSNSRTTANGGGRFYLNNDVADVAQSSLTGTADVGGIIGGKGAASNGVTATYTCFDLYEFALWKGTLNNTQGDAIAAAMVSNWSLPTWDRQAILLGDSITECVDTTSTTVIPADNIAMTLTAPGAELVPDTVKVINAAVGGSGVVSEFTGLALVNQRDDANGPLKYLYPGGAANNIVTCNIGINDMRSSGGNLSAASHYANVVALINTTTTGYLQRGFKVVAVTPTAISGDGTGQGRILSYRDLLINSSTDVIVSQFLTDCNANTGQTYDGLLTVLPLCKVEYGGGTVFLNATDAADTTYYSSDGTHMTQLGYQLEATGGATPLYGYGPFLNSSDALPEQPSEPVASDLPSITGSAVDGSTLTVVNATWSETPSSFEYEWQISPSPFTIWTAISGATASTYVVQTSDIGSKIRVGERAVGAGGVSDVVYSDPTGIVAASLPSLPVINTTSQPTPTSGNAQGDIVSIPAPSITGATSWWVSWDRNGVGSEAFADDTDTYPVSYTLQAQDAVNSLVLRTYASNAAGAVVDYSTDIGPVAPNSTSIIDYGSGAATKAQIISLFASNWTKTGTATQTRTVTTPDALMTLWDSEIKTGALTEKWEVTLDWDGLLNWNGVENTTAVDGNNAYMQWDGPAGTTGWSDAGGWVHFKNASGKRPGFTHQARFPKGRGIYLEGIDFAGRFNPNATKNASNSSTSQASLNIGANSVIAAYNCRFGRYAKTLSLTLSDLILGVWSESSADQVLISKCTFAGTFVPFKMGARFAKITNCDFSKNAEDFLKTYPQTATGVVCYYWFDHLTIRDMIDDIGTATYHSDLLQTANNDASLGVCLLLTNIYDIRDHKYGGSAGGGTQGTVLSGIIGHCNNLMSWHDSLVMVSAPTAYSTIAMDADYTSYIENCTLGRAGIVPSLFDGDAGNRDYSPGLAFNNAPSKSGTAVKVVNSLIGKKSFGSFISYDANTVVVDYTTTQASPTPEDVFNGADFERGGATANFIANKFGYAQDQSTQQAWLTWITDNLVAQGAYSGRGAPAPVLANYSAPALG